MKESEIIQVIDNKIALSKAIISEMGDVPSKPNHLGAIEALTNLREIIQAKVLEEMRQKVEAKRQASKKKREEERMESYYKDKV